MKNLEITYPDCFFCQILTQFIKGNIKKCICVEIDGAVIT